MKITVHVKPGASKQGVEISAEGMIIVRVHARPEGGKANDAVREVLAKTLGIAKSLVEIETAKSRTKNVVVPDSAAQALKALART